MHLNAPTWAAIALITIGVGFSVPVLVQGFRRRGKGVKYEHNFLIQRAPQMATFFNVLAIFVAFTCLNLRHRIPVLSAIFTSRGILPSSLTAILSWCGVAILISGLVFMIGGWYSLGECFSTDAEVLEGHTVRNDGLLKWVMHPAYSGIIQTVLGLSLAAGSLFCALITVAVVAPLWLNRAKYEEQLLIENLGPSYTEYARQLKWRRLVPSFIPIGV